MQRVTKFLVIVAILLASCAKLQQTPSLLVTDSAAEIAKQWFIMARGRAPLNNQNDKAAVSAIAEKVDQGIAARDAGKISEAQARFDEAALTAIDSPESFRQMIKIFATVLNTDETATPYNSATFTTAYLASSGIGALRGVPRTGFDRVFYENIQVVASNSLVTDIQTNFGITVPAADEDNNNHYTNLGNALGRDVTGQMIDWSKLTLGPQVIVSAEPAGILTHRTVGASILTAGTNRAIDKFLANYMNLDVKELWFLLGGADTYVSHQVNRVDPQYSIFCVGCHIHIDPVSYILARYNFNGRVESGAGSNGKYRRDIAQQINRIGYTLPNDFTGNEAIPLSLQGLPEFGWRSENINMGGPTVFFKNFTKSEGFIRGLSRSILRRVFGCSLAANDKQALNRILKVSDQQGDFWFPKILAATMQECRERAAIWGKEIQ